MTKMSSGDLRALLAAERADALSAMSASKLAEERAAALDYYLGDMARDMPAPDGRSKAVSTDVADTIEGLMPSLMEIFTAGDEVVRFEPVGPEDVDAAEQETDYVNHVFMQQNPGFLVLYSFIKDALLSKVGIVKVWWETREELERETYLDLDDAAFAIISADPDVEIVEHTVREAKAPQVVSRPIVDTVPQTGLAAPRAAVHAEPVIGSAALAAESAGGQPRVSPGSQIAALIGVLSPTPDQTGAERLHDVTVQTKRTHAFARVEGVPPEEFGIARHARSIRDTDYCFHDVLRSEARLIEQGYDREQVRRLPSYVVTDTIEARARDTVNEGTQGQGDDGDDGINSASRLIRITEHYVRMDYDGNGRAALYRVTTGGEEGAILDRDGEPDVIAEDAIPFAAMTPVIITHRFFGRSIADLVMDIQRIKTALLRALLDNAYLANNPRTEVPESHATDTTLDDLLVSRPGGIVRTKMPGGLSIIAHPDVGGHVFPLLQYQDATREWRTGVSRQGQGVDPNALQNQVATIANQMFNAAQAKVKMIARIFAETGIRDLFALLHALVRKHGSNRQVVRLRNQWVTVDPRDWKVRNDMTVHVGLGTGSKSEQLAHLMSLIGLQKEALAAGKSNLVSDANLYNSARELTKLLGLKNVDRYFTDPKTQPPPQAPPNPAVIEMQLKNEIEKTQAQADIATQQKKIESEMALAQQRFELEKQLKLLDARIKVEEHRRNAITDVVKAGMAREDGRQRPDAEASPRVGSESASGPSVGPAPDANGEAPPAAAPTGALSGTGGNAALIMTLLDTLNRISAPKRARKMPDGSWVTETVQPAE
jgi:hypothetical protein